MFKIFVLLVSLLFSSLALAHGGRVASDGCHNDKSAGERHCHGASSVKPAKPKVKKSKRSEADYVNQTCLGTIEFVLPDKTRVDCLNDTHAIEYDFQNKWAEAIGQSLHYSLMTGKRAGIRLICKNSRCGKYEARINAIIELYSLPVDVETIN